MTVDSTIDGAVVDECRHHGLRIEGHVRRRELLAAQDVDVARLPGERLLGQREPHFGRASGATVVIQNQRHDVQLG